MAGARVFFVKKVENGGVFFCKKVDLSSTQGALRTVSVFFILHCTYLGECVRTRRTPPLPTGLGRKIFQTSCVNLTANA